jgi:hypothetical protein
MATQSEINAALGLPPGINPDGSWNAQDYMARRVAGQVDTQAQVDAARAAARAELMAAPGQYVTDASGRQVSLTAYKPDFDPNNITTQTYLGELAAAGGQDSTSSLFNQTVTPAQLAANAAAWATEKARLEEIDRQAALAQQADQGKTMASATKANPSALPAGFLEGLAAMPNISDQQIVAAMKAANVSPKNLADGLGITEGEIAARVAATVPQGQSIQLGDTIVQPQYQVTGSGENQQVGPIENVFTYRASDNKVGGGYTQYAADGSLERTGTQMKVNATQDFLKFAALAGAMFGGAALAGIGEGAAATTAAGTTTGTGLLTGGAGTAAGTSLGTGLTAGSSLSGLTAGSSLSGLTTGAGALTGANTLLGGATLGSTLGGLTTGVGAGALTAGALTGASTLGSGALTASQLGSLVSGGLTLGGGLLQQQTSREAAQAAQQRIDAETAAAKQAAQFRPVGMTTRFGTSEFKVDPVTGQITSAGYTLSPGALEAQNRLVALGNQGLAQAEAAQQQFAPLQTGAQNLFNLGNQYIAQSPEQVAQNYLNQQMALLQPSRELELANLQNKLQQQGRGGLSVAQGGNLGATTPELQALFNARAQQEAQLAAQAQQAGQQQVAFGAGLLGTGAQTMGQYYAGQQAAYAPYTTALGQVQALETAAQQPFTMGVGLGQTAAQAGANVGQLGLKGAGLSTALATGEAATNNPYASLLSGLGGSNTFGTAAGNLLGGLFGMNAPVNALSSAAYGPGNAGFQNMLNDIYG